MTKPSPDIPENNSEKPKPRRGRPPRFDPELEKMYRDIGLLAGDKTRRSHLDVLWRQKALEVLWDRYRPEFAWLADDIETTHAGKGRIKRTSILAELGRLEDPEVILATAGRLCDLKPTAREAIAMLRRFRLGREPEGTVEGLTRAILKAVDLYVATHATSREEILTALEQATGRWGEDDDGGR